MSKILVTGGNGFLGTWLTKKLVARGEFPTLLTRKESDLGDLAGLRFGTVTGDITDLNSLVAAFRGFDTVFHLAGLIAYKKSDRAKMDRVNVTGTQNVLEACKQAGVKKLVYLSSVVAVGAGFNRTQILNEDSSFNVAHLNLGYFQTKLAAEKLVLAACHRSEIDAVILNPSTIYGPGDAKKGSRTTQVKVAQGKFPFYTSGGVSIADVDDVTEGILSGWQKGRSGERYILSGDNVTIKQLFDMIAGAAGAKPPEYLIPNFLLHGVGIWGDLTEKLGLKTAISRENAWTATLFHWFDHSKATRELGYKPRPAIESIQKSVAWMKDNGYIS